MTSDHPNTTDTPDAGHHARSHASTTIDPMDPGAGEGPVYGPPIPPPPIPLWGWPPTPKLQIVLFAVACGLINLILLGVWALVLYTR